MAVPMPAQSAGIGQLKDVPADRALTAEPPAGHPAPMPLIFSLVLLPRHPRQRRACGLLLLLRPCLLLLHPCLLLLHSCLLLHTCLSLLDLKAIVWQGSGQGRVSGWR